MRPTGGDDGDQTDHPPQLVGQEALRRARQLRKVQGHPDIQAGARSGHQAQEQGGVEEQQEEVALPAPFPARPRRSNLPRPQPYEDISGGRMRMLRASTVTGFLMAAGLSLTAAAPADLESRRKAMKDLLADHWEYTLSHNPEFASILGDKRWNDKWTDFSQAEIEAGLAKTKEYLGRFESIDPTGFPDQEALTRTLLVRSFREQLEDARFKNWEIPVTQIYGVHIDAPQLVSLLSFETVKDYDDYVARLKALPALMDQTVVQMRKGMSEELMPAKFLLEKVVTQAQGIADKKPEDSPFAVPLAKIPATFSDADKARVREAILSAIRDSIAPAYVKFTKFVREEYAPRGRKE